MTALLITAIVIIVCLAFWLWCDKGTIDRQLCEILALQADNLRLRGQAAELATLAHDAQDLAGREKERADNLNRQCDALGHVVRADSMSVAMLPIQERKTEQAEAMLAGEIAAHRATKRTLATTRAWVTRLRKASDER